MKTLRRREKPAKPLLENHAGKDSEDHQVASRDVSLGSAYYGIRESHLQDT